jgi:peptidoglycan/LPS O-acetylase OafA/YrhL
MTAPVTLPTSKPSGALPGIDLLRFLAAVLVMVFHLAYWSWHEADYPTGVRAALNLDASFPELAAWSWWGWVGVPIFFTISGFVISLSAQRGTAASFLRGRVLRIAPALWFFASLTLIVTLIYSSIGFSEALILYAKSVTFWPQGPWLDGVYWTLTVEVLFYVAIFLLLMVGRFHKLEVIVCCWCVLSAAFWLFALADHGLHGWDSDSGAFVGVRDAYLCRALLISSGPFFQAGIALCLMRQNGISARRLALFGTALVAGAIALYFEALSYVGDEALGAHTFIPVMVWVGAVLCMATYARRAHRRQSPVVATVSRGLGLATYPLYLLHNITGAWILGIAIRQFGHPELQLVLVGTGCILVSAAFARWIEPWLRDALAQGLAKMSAVTTGRADDPRGEFNPS